MARYFSVSHLLNLSPLETHALYKLRVDTFVCEQQCSYPEIDDIDALDTTFHILTWLRNDDGNTILQGCARLFPSTVAHFQERSGTVIDLADDAEIFEFGRLAVTKEVRGTGLAEEIILNSLRLAHEENPGKDVILSAQKPLQSFYEAYGFKVCGPEYLDWKVPHIPMVYSAEQLKKFTEQLAD